VARTRCCAGCSSRARCLPWRRWGEDSMVHSSCLATQCLQIFFGAKLLMTCIRLMRLHQCMHPGMKKSVMPSTCRMHACKRTYPQACPEVCTIALGTMSSMTFSKACIYGTARSLNSSPDCLQLVMTSSIMLITYSVPACKHTHTQASLPSVACMQPSLTPTWG
jgi:hypothetical protein